MGETLLTYSLSTLLQQSLDYFQTQEPIPAQAHLARTVHRKAIAFEAEGVKFMGKAMQAAAKEAWITVREARNLPVPDGAVLSLTGDDFDAEVEFWYR